MTLAGNSTFSSGNSLGGTPGGQTDEGYVTIGTRDTGLQNVTVNNDATLECMTLQTRLGTTNVTLNDQSKLKIHNVFAGSGTIVATRPSYLASGSPGTTAITLRGSSAMLVDCLVGNTASNGPNGVNRLHVGRGENLQSANASDPNTYNSTVGGTAVLDVGGNASLDIKQGLHLGFGTAASPSGTLRVVGPDATVKIGGNLNLAFNEYVNNLVPNTGARPGTGALHFVITGSTQSKILVDGLARVSNGTLKLSLQAYMPPLATSYTLIQAAGVDRAFKTIDVSRAALSGSNDWTITNTSTSVIATVSNPLIDTTPGVSQIAPINIGANRSVTDIVGAGTFSGVIQNGFGSLSLTKEGTGTQELTGANTYSGDTIVNNGSLAITGNSIADSNKLISHGGTINLTGDETVGTLFFGPTQKIPGTYSATGVGGTIASANFTGAGTLTVTSGPVSAYSSWIDSPAFNSPPLTTEQKLPIADADKDGMSNLLEYALNGNPSISDQTIRPVIDSSGSTFIFSYNRFDDSLADTSQTFQYGNDLSGYLY